MDALDFLVPLAAATLRTAVPLVLAAFAGLFSERAGIVDIGLEGKMLAGAFTAAAIAAVTGNVWAGLAAAIVVCALFGLLHGLACIRYRGDQVISGMAINILVQGLTVTLGLAWFAQGGNTPALNDARFHPITLPGAEALANVPVLGPIYGTILSGNTILTYLTYALVPCAAWVLYATRFGLRLRAVGENPAAVDTAGISVARLRYQAVVIAGVLCGIAGTYMSTAIGAGFARDMTAGRGYIALAALIVGKWRPYPTLITCLLFAALDAVAIRLQGVELPGIGTIPVQAVEVLPYVLTVVLLAGFIGRSIAPKASGVAYVKER